MSTAQLSALEICAGAGGQSSGLERAGFGHELAVEIDRDAATTLRKNRPGWGVHEGDVRDIDGKQYKGIDLLAGGVPCPPFSLAGKQLGADDERDLFPEALRLVREARPSAVMLENVRGLASARFSTYRQSILAELERLGYTSDWQLLYSSEFGVPQLRPRFILVAFRGQKMKGFSWPRAVSSPRLVGETLYPLMAANGWDGAETWAKRAAGIAPTIVGGSKKHGGADLGPTRAKQAWLALGVDGRGVADAAPTAEDSIDHLPKLTNPMVARIQGFDSEWRFTGRKTSVYRQIGNAFPPPVAEGVGTAIRHALGAGARRNSLAVVA
ncbi:DNA cytosine methyltransferase [Rathayibacter toxicus]|uniref:Cytosine-specific methyltransferase n=2 Tax=Rathayibacter toxicus TaxID=145458 RepID=A0A0C5B816_9MICO|nr:DNA cytosine methyltransferase [Rathayibacter toxicus]AJM76898.1 modification methylase [Rathayibacter toxicus]ALS57330.1 modification methylase [Rathayibacter toxicus]KKM45701.1 modification methylase [Rathayibacter toxicus]PPG24792.1 DNA cytosine methyltransferase [Rathayibacter toxicus]PPG48247.1 DNA cytosine methyltransferase [Rathayibacter toxicus]